MFRDRVVGHYVGRGYRVDANAVLTSDNGRKHKLDLLATDDLGRIAVWFGDQEPFEGPELQSLRIAAKELGVAPVIAAPQVNAVVRDHARTQGIVILDEASIQSESDKHVRPLPPRNVPETSSTELPPWPEPTDLPDPGAATEEPVAAPWRESIPDPTEADGPKPFAWLPEEPALGAPTDLVRPAGRSTQTLMPKFWAPLLIGAFVVLIGLLLLAFLL